MQLTPTQTQRMTGEFNDIQRVRATYSDATGELGAVVAYVDGGYVATQAGAPYWCRVVLAEWGTSMRRVAA